MRRRTLYRAIKPYRTGRLKVSSRHELYFEESGNPRGKPALFVHGGPGGATSARHRRFFDPGRYRIVLFDQRGCGKSTPVGEIDENTTWHLVDDMERLRETLEIDRWQLFGGSWGSALSLAYAEKHPNRVSEIVLRGIFLLRKREIDWFYQYGASVVFPEAWAEYVDPIPEEERNDLLHAYFARLRSDDSEVCLRAARSWTAWEKRTSYLRPHAKEVKKVFEDDDYALAFARLECHYFVQRGFFESESQLLDGIDRIRDIPAVIVQGRYDMVCPIETAWDLHLAWPEAEFRVVPDAGHSAFEGGITHELVLATDSFCNA